VWRYYTEPKPLCITKPFFVVSEAYMKEFSNRQPHTQPDSSGGQRFIQVMRRDKPGVAFQSLP